MLTGLFFIIICAVVGYYASTLGRTGFGWAIISAIITPFLASLILLILGKTKKPTL